ncbi:hypothetical protein EDC94DRAFT_601576 [Helicostylum pulchrum]|nr:hypothetical protein EDC94DRAFT_601576 [Helicostylum pulchrum]
MDPTVLDDMMNHINDEEEEEEEQEEEEEEEEQEDEEAEEEEEDEEAEEEDDKMEEDEPQVPETLEQKSTAKRFRDLYMTRVTQAFGADLDIIRQEPNLNGARLNILIDSLEAGIDIFSSLEQEIILADEEK